MTERYAHLADEALMRASEKTSEDLRRAQERGKEKLPELATEEKKLE